MKVSIIGCLIILLLFSCSNKAPKPDNLIPEGKMVDIIYDVSILTAAKGVNRKLIENNGILPEEFIYNKHNIDSLQFVSSLNYYASDPEKYDNIYTRVDERIQAKKENIGGATKNDKKDEPITDRSRVLLTKKQIEDLSKGLISSKVGLSVEKEAYDFNNKTVLKMSRSSITSSSYMLIRDIKINNGDEVIVSVLVKNTNDKSAFGLRISGTYPNRVDAIFDLNNDKVIGTKAIGYFENETASIISMENGWFECKLKTKANIDDVQILYGPTNIDKPIGVWTVKSDTLSSVLTTIPIISIE
ncbi:DUF4296 domain-containing protein [uncultured Psychroserpens sp.]|uniref:DUF4296 domain-containing protein n=1 Tax=uncultured Psychroserpens sp. TaxID=255436 RepID=UPI00260D6E71|nr:DUF4296 domain-containing protein [uncultured Psychroserpens sp.]